MSLKILKEINFLKVMKKNISMSFPEPEKKSENAMNRKSNMSSSNLSTGKRFMKST